MKNKIYCKNCKYYCDLEGICEAKTRHPLFLRKRIKYGEWYKIINKGANNIVACPIKKAKNNYQGQRVYKCKSINRACGAYGDGRQDCTNCDPKKYTCFWIGFIGPKVPKIKAKLLYEE